MTWSSVPGKRYQLRVSPDLSTGSWNPVGEAMEGDGSIQGKGITLTQPDGSTPAKLFFRLEIGDTPSSISGSGNSAYHDYILTLHPEYANPGNGGNNPGGGNQNPPPADSDHDGFADEDDAVPTDALIDWKKTPGFQYVWIPVAGAPEGYRAIDVNNKGQILFENRDLVQKVGQPFWYDSYKTTPVGKLWDPAKPEADRWQDIFLRVSPFILNISIHTSYANSLYQKGGRSVQLDESVKMNRFGLKALADDGSVIADFEITFYISELIAGTENGPEGPQYKYSQTGSVGTVLRWNGNPQGEYDEAQLMGEEPGFDYVDPEGRDSTTHMDFAAGFYTDTLGVPQAAIYDYIRGPEEDGPVSLLAYPLTENASTSTVALSGLPNHLFTGRNITRSGRVMQRHSVEGVEKCFISGGLDLSGLNGNATLTDLPGGGWAIGGPGTALQIFKNGSLQNTTASGITEFDEVGTGIGGATFQDPGTNGHDIWRNGEWFSLKDATGNTDLNALIAPQRITSKGIIWAGDIQKINNGILVPLQLVSRDKFLAGSFEVPEGWETSELEFLGPEGSLGKYGKLLGGGTTKIYGKVEDVLDAPDLTGAGGQPDEQQVWFVRNAINPRKVDFYTCFNETGDVHVVLHVNGHMVGETIHQLTPDADFAHFIDYVDQWVKGTGFNSTGGGTDPPLALRSRGMERALADGGIHNLSRAALIPFFNVIGNVENLGSVAVGLFDGVKNGISDDWELIQLITNGVVTGGGWAYEQAEAELLKWRSDPRKRAVELKQAADRLCKEWVFKPMSELGSDLSTWEGFKKRSWSAWEVTKRTGVRSWALTQSAWESIKTGMSTWADDFGNRMLAGAEKAHWTGAPWNMSQLQGDINEYSRRASYIFGYTFGYVGEQAAICLLTGGSAEIANVMARGGVEAASLLAARKVLPMAARLHLVKKWAASTAVSIEMKIALERGLTLAAETPISAVLKDSCAEVIERGMARLSYERGAFSSFHILDEILNAPFIKKLCQTAGHEGQFWEQLARYFHIMEEKATAPASKGWVKAYNRSLKFEGEVLIDDRADDLFKIFKTETEEGREALRKSLQEFGETDGNGKFWFKDVEKVYDYLYHHFPATGANRLIIKNGNVYLREFSGERGWYVTGTKIDYQGPAKDLLQLPYIENGRYRCKFSTAQAKDKLKIPRGQQNEAEFFECLAKDYPDNGNGLGTQLLLEQKEVALEEIFDTVLQRALTAQEIELLINP